MTENEAKLICDRIRQAAYGLHAYLNYLQATRLDHGLLLNFGSPKFQCRKLIRRQ